VQPRKRSAIDGNTKLCTSCDQFLPFDCFTPARRSLGGLSAFCIDCWKQRYYNKDKAKETTRRYRIRHRERHLALHRLRTFERNTRRRVRDDGTVTTVFLKSLYAQTHCTYCFLPVPKEKRTADHVVALASGGQHSRRNLVMACFSCNSSKRDMPVEQFRKIINADKKHYEKYLAYYLPKRIK
jgi:5-methylcytosine-specific restriction endonuclease McrA